VLLKLTVLCCACVAIAKAQSSLESPNLLRAGQTVDQLRALVDAGFAPRQKLEEAEEVLADARDAEFIHRMLGSNDLTEEHAAEAKDAAQRRLNRVKAKIEQRKRLVDAGVLPSNALTALLEEQQWAQTQFDLAVSYADVIHEIAEMALAEQQRAEIEAVPSTRDDAAVQQLMERFDGTGVFASDDLKKVQSAFEQEFTRPLPISALGETAVHRAMHFDHSNRVDVAVLPDTPEGLWLRRYLEEAKIPYYAFRGAVPGKATGAHIHIGPPSRRI
jgi:hypothetical protein